MSDKGHELTDKKLKELENKLKEHYKQASDEVKKKLDDYLKAFKAKDAKHLADLQKDFTKENYEEYIRWRQGQVLISERWEEMRQSLAEDYHNANMIAKSIIKGYMPDIYALNHNYGTYDVEHKGLVDTSYTLYDRQTVERLMRDDPDMLPPPGRKVSKRIAEGKDILWNKGQIQSAMWQSVTQGESMEKIAHRLARTVGDKDMAAAIRNARTMTTGAECAGRVDSYKRAESMGIDLQQEWMSTLDNRTRHSHRAMHGERIPVDGTFSNGCRFPGDPHGPAEEVYNCRCTLVSAIKGFEGDKVTYSPKMGDMSFEEWVGEHEKGLDKTGESGIIREGSNQKPITEITDSAIERVPNVKISGYTDEQCAEIQKQHKELLEYSRKNNENKEVAFVFDNLLSDRKEFIGKDDILDFGGYLYGKDLFVMHNHPRNSSYSVTDLIFFKENSNVKTLTIVKNNGRAEILTKNENYDSERFKLEYDRLYRKIVKNDTDEEKNKFVRALLNKNKSGVIWSERKQNYIS